MTLQDIMRQGASTLTEALEALSKAAGEYVKASGNRPALAVYPVRPYYSTGAKPGKAPLTSNGFKGASRDPQTVENWWKSLNHGDHHANIGAPTGSVNGIVVIDVDVHPEKTPPEDARPRFDELQAQLGALPTTWTAATGSGNGGRHYYFRYPQGAKIGIVEGSQREDLGKGIDIRGEGGCIILPPSLHASTTETTLHAYRWIIPPEDTPLADLPPAWVEFLERVAPIQSDKQTSSNGKTSSGDAAKRVKFKLPEIIGEGGRNSTLHRYACSLRAYGYEADAIEAELLKVNAERCTPPLSTQELHAIARSAASKEAGFSPDYQRHRDTESPKPDYLDFSDLGNAAAFIRLNKDDLLYTKSGGWHVWTGTRYQQGDHLAMGRAIDYADLLLQDALKEYRDASTKGDEAATKGAEAYLRYAKSSRKVHNLKGMLEGAQVHYHAEASSLDHNPFILNTPWGMVDLHTGEYLFHDKSERCTLSTPNHVHASTQEEEESGGAQLWRDFVQLVTAGDLEYADYLQTVIGSSLIGKPLVEGLFVVYGDGRNGKSTFFKALQLALGSDYTGNINADVFTSGYNRDRENAMTPLVGKRLVCCGELEEGLTLSTSTTKRIASTDDLVVRRLYADRESVHPSHHVFLFTNHLPKVNTTDGGTWRRLHVLPFTATMPDGDKDIPDYGSYLAEEAGETILQWCIDGAVKFTQRGYHLPPCDAVKLATREYQQQEDTVAQFLDERIDQTGDPADVITASHMFDMFNAYVTKYGRKGKTKPVFTSELEKRGLTWRTEKRVMRWLGVKVKDC